MGKHKYEIGDTVQVSREVVEDLPPVPGLQEKFSTETVQAGDYLAKVAYKSYGYPVRDPEYLVEFVEAPEVANMRFMESDLVLVETKQISALTRAIADAERVVDNLKILRAGLLARI